jgi:hypothetical protein
MGKRTKKTLKQIESLKKQIEKHKKKILEESPEKDTPQNTGKKKLI